MANSFSFTTAPQRVPYYTPRDECIAYGGCTLGVAVHAASKSVPSSFLVYSILGQFLGPALTDQRLTCRVYRVRDTRTFATRRIMVTQALENGGKRECLQLLADFQTKETPLLLFSAPPSLHSFLQHICWTKR
jgi:acyl-CoA thioesterase